MWLQFTHGSVPFSSEFDDPYFSIEGGLDETRLVFLDQGSLWEKLPSQQSSILVGELGFGTGLNFFSAWKSFFESSTGSQKRLRFFSVEQNPLSPKEIQKSLRPYLEEFKSQLQEFLAQYRYVPGPGRHTYFLQNGCVELNLLIGPVKRVLPEIHDSMDAWFLDGFAPARNPEMWSEEVLSLVAIRSKIGTELRTYTAAAQVRRTLEKNGFQVKKEKGFDKFSRRNHNGFV